MRDSVLSSVMGEGGAAGPYITQAVEGMSCIPQILHPSL